MRLKRACALVLLGLLAACSRSPEKVPSPANETIVAPGAEADVVEAANGAEPAPALSEPPLDELAGVKVGKTIADLRAQGFKVVKDDGPDPTNSCGYARIAGLEDLFFMLDRDTVVRIDVDTPGRTTLGGVAIGMKETEALRHLGGRAKIEAHPNTGPDGHYLVVHRDGAPLGLIVETDGKKVVNYRIGRWAYVRSQENCL